MDHLRPSTNSDKLSEGLCQLSGVPESGGEGTRLLHWGAAGRPTARRWRVEDRAPQGHPGSARAPGEEREHLLLTEAVARNGSACVVGCSWQRGVPHSPEFSGGAVLAHIDSLPK